MKRLNELGISRSPWMVMDAGIPNCIVDGDGKIIATVHAHREMEFNARLMVYSPDLYDVCRRLVSALRNRLPSEPTLAEAELLVEAERGLKNAGGDE